MTHLTQQTEAELLVQQQLDAYNNKDIKAWLDCYHSDAVSGHDQMRQRISVRFTEPDLKATLLKRMVMGEWVIDHEVIQRNFPEGRGQMEMLCSYQVKQGLIVKALFQAGEVVLF